MANFTTHLYGGALISSFGALGLYSAGLAGPEEAQSWFFLGVAGGLLPDIDADNSAPVRGFFNLLGAVLAFLVTFALVGRVPIVELVLLWAAVFLLVRYGFFELFARFTMHRGIWHSWLAAAFAALATTDTAHHLLGMSAWESWIGGLFVALGYLTHLGLDELASVDLLNNRIKRSIGTAFKPVSLSCQWCSALMLVALIALTLVSPTLQPVLEAGRDQGLSVEAMRLRVLGDTGWLAGLREALQ